MECREWNNQSEWEALVANQSHASFLQSWAWGDFQNAAGNVIQRIGVADNGKLVGAALVIERELPLGQLMLFTPRGPVVAGSAYQMAVSHIADELMRQEKLAWRFEPLEAIKIKGANRVTDVEPAVTRMLDLSSPEEQLLANMKQKTRYNIRLAEKRGVTVEFVSGTECANEEYRSAWLRLVDETSERHGIRHHGAAYYNTLFSVLGESGLLECAAARFNNEIIAMNVNVRYGDTYTYMYGAASHEQKSVMAPHALQWQSIQRAQAAGFAWYDFYGVAPEGIAQHPLAGVTRFKEGFGGQIIEYPGTFELPFAKVPYLLYRVVKQVRSR